MIEIGNFKDLFKRKGTGEIPDTTDGPNADLVTPAATEDTQAATPDVTPPVTGVVEGTDNLATYVGDTSSDEPISLDNGQTHSVLEDQSSQRAVEVKTDTGQNDDGSEDKARVIEDFTDEEKRRLDEAGIEEEQQSKVKMSDSREEALKLLKKIQSQRDETKNRIVQAEKNEKDFAAAKANPANQDYFLRIRYNKFMGEDRPISDSEWDAFRSQAQEMADDLPELTDEEMRSLLIEKEENERRKAELAKLDSNYKRMRYGAQLQSNSSARSSSVDQDQNEVAILNNADVPNDDEEKTGSMAESPIGLVDEPPADEPQAVVDALNNIEVEVVDIPRQQEEELDEEELISYDAVVELVDPQSEEVDDLVQVAEQVTGEEEQIVDRIREHTEAVRGALAEIEEQQRQLDEIQSGARFDEVAAQVLAHGQDQEAEEGTALSWFQKRVQARKENKARRISRARRAEYDWSTRMLDALHTKMDEGDKQASERLAERRKKIKKDAMFAVGGLVATLATPLIAVAGTGASLYGLTKGGWDVLRGTATALNKGLAKSGRGMANTALEASGAGREAFGASARAVVKRTIGTPEVEELLREEGFQRGLSSEIQAQLDRQSQQIELLTQLVRDLTRSQNQG